MLQIENLRKLFLMLLLKLLRRKDAKVVSLFWKVTKRFAAQMFSKIC